nr:hypothetical protein [Gammaproteobacteria bacterium]
MILHITYPDGTALIYTRNFFGLELTHTDLSHAEYTSNYNYAAQLTSRVGKGGDHGQKLYVFRTSSNTDNGPEWHISTVAGAVPNLIVTRRYLAGRLMSEQSNDSTTSYGHDAEGRLLQRILTIQDETLQSSIHTQHNYVDLQGRDIMLTDNNLKLTPGYDLNGNRVHLNSLLTIDRHPWIAKESWNTFSKTDNELISGGTVVNGFVTVGEGYAFSYANGLRHTESHNNITSTLGYDKDKLLTTVTRPDGTLTRTFNTSYDLTRITTSNNEQYDFKYDRNGWSIGQNYYKDTNLVTQVDIQVSKRGLPVSQQTQNYVKSNSDNNNARDQTLIVDRVDYLNALFDEPEVKQVSGTRTVNPLKRKGTPLNATTVYHNADGSAGAITGQQDETDPKAKYPTLVTFQSTASKSIFTKNIYKGFGDPDGLTFEGTESHFLSPKDQNLGVFNATTGAADLSLVRRAVTDFGGIEVGNASKWRGKESDFTPMLDPAGPYVEERHLSPKQQMQAMGDNFRHP